MNKEFIIWLAKDKMMLKGKDWVKHLPEILDQKYAEYMGWA
ncbi:MAG: hypothetical protein ACE5H1_00805 [Thermodesulfobacteriota bacterium]